MFNCGQPPPPSIKIPLIQQHQRPNLKIWKCPSLDIILNISHTNLPIWSLIEAGNCPTFLSTRSCRRSCFYSFANSRNIVKNLLLIHYNHLNRETYPSLDIILKISHTNFRTNLITNRGRKLSFWVFELFLQLLKWYKPFNSRNIVKNLLRPH